MRELSIYIHIPFCVRKCLYCDFLSFPVSVRKFGRGLCDNGIAGAQSGECQPWVDSSLPAASQQEYRKKEVRDGSSPAKRSATDDREGKPAGKILEAQAAENIESYVKLLRREIIQEAGHYENHQVISIFWGGGTPSLLGADFVSEIMETLRRCYHIAEDAEITIEANPGTVTAAKLRGYITAGINRISIGLQSTDDRELARIGRIHDYGAFLETYGLAREAGFRNVNIDLMAALPGQSVSSYQRTLQRVAALMPEHISAYSLILEEGTPLYERQGQYRFPTEEEDREMYLLTNACLASCGYHRYEISNYAREGYECRHNKVYWQRGDYAGFGLGAASMVENIRWSNPVEPENYAAYIAGLESGSGKPAGQKPAEEAGCFPVRQRLTGNEQMEEFMFLGLRMMCGVSRQAFRNQFGRQIEEVYGEVLCNMYRQKLLVCESDHIKLTDPGIDVSNRVMAEFLFD
ncbi:MAG: radical SAM family heme chaperone HemW [Lachnospiraceae bacterium]|nr:radical SAM family heme chaperone HemW [Lachnospiraceae bacterium]